MNILEIADKFINIAYHKNEGDAIKQLRVI